MATAPEIAKFRRQVGDPVKADADVQTASGQDQEFALRYNNLFDSTVYLNNVVQTTGFTLDEAVGLISFDTAPANGVVVKVSYKYAAYTDDEASDLIDEYGTENATVEAIKELLANASRLYNYQQGQTKAEKNQVFQNLKDLLKIYKEEAASAANNGSGGLTIGKRTNEAYRRTLIPSEDLSRTDQWGG